MVCITYYCAGKTKFLGIFGGSGKVMDLKTELKNYLFPSGNDPIVLCEDSVKFAMVMSTFQHYEQLVSWGWVAVTLHVQLV